MAVIVLAFVAIGQAAPQRPSSSTLTLDASAPGTFRVATTAAPLRATIPLGPALTLPSGVLDARLSAIPDRLLNDPPAARFRTPVSVRGRAGLAASAEGPAVVAWSEGGYWYELGSSHLTTSQLIDLASALR